MNPIDPERYYEVTALHPNDVYREDMIGSIIKPEVLLSGKVEPTISKLCPGYYAGGCNMIQGNGLYDGVETGFFYAVMLRPLTMKEQEKINESTRRHDT